MTSEATPLVMAETTHRVPDGSRKLIVMRPTKELRLAKSNEPRRCYVSLTVEDPPRSCMRTIEPGRYFLLHQSIHPNGQLGARHRYCAPCAIREWHRRGVIEDVK